MTSIDYVDVNKVYVYKQLAQIDMDVNTNSEQIFANFYGYNKFKYNEFMDIANWIWVTLR